MKQRNIKHEKRLKKLVLTCLLLAVVLTVGTYAWFIGMQTVGVEAFEVKIAAVDDLALSLDAENWSSDLIISEAVLKGNAYAKTTFAWTNLKPVSTVGKIDPDTSKLIMFDKGSLTATEGGYRLLSARVQNKAATIDESTGLVKFEGEGETFKNYVNEEDGYVAFDLFIKNMSGDAYYSEATTANEEAIYLVRDSSVTGGTAGYTGSGIENSVRIAFAQIGRVKIGSDATTIKTAQQITCKDPATGVTALCAKKDAAIYEPNDKAHTTAAIEWYNKTCYIRDKDNGGAYTNVACKDYVDPTTSTKIYTLATDTFFPTYAVSNEIETTGVDVYDGINGYTANTSSAYSSTSKLVNVDTFTDTEKAALGTSRKEIFSLAPNSITKVRVYLYLEGQDVDNFDFASLGKQVVAQFGFTKERFTVDDYDDQVSSLQGVIVPGAENFNSISYNATNEVTDVSSTKVLYDAKTKAFWYDKDETTLTTFTFKDGETEKTATYDSADKKWTIS